MSENPIQHNVPPLDFERLEIVAETDAEQADILQMFYRMSAECISAMENSRRQEDGAQWKANAHSLKGAAANLGMLGLEEICLRAEKGVALNDDQRGALLQGMRNELQHIASYFMMRNPAFPDLKI